MVEIKNLTKRFGAFKAVDNVSFTVDKGEVLGFLGPNGAGKSTTMKMATGFLSPDGGSVTIGGNDISTHPIDVKKRIGYLPEGAPLYGDMTPRAFLKFVASIRGLNRSEMQRRIDAVVEQVSLAEVLNKPIDTLSKGFKRRVGLAQAILHDPEVLILDEPTDGLDPNQKHEVRNLIASMSAGKVIILSTHILEEVEAVCSRAIIIAAGKLVTDGTPAELLARSSLHNAVCATIRGELSEACRKALQGLPAVATVAADALPDTRTRIVVTPKADAKPLETVSDLLRAHAVDVDEIFVERGSLDDVFRTITADAGGRS
jgi:ABC-2 type transport system ATP-binding protein